MATSVSLDGTVPELAQRAMGIVAESNGALYVYSAYRSWVKQAFLYAMWIAHVPGYFLAAKPGQSKHNTGEAIDFEENAVGAKVNLLPGLAKKWGLHRTVEGENWHYELDPNRKPLANSVPAQPPTEEEEMSDRLVVTYPSGVKTWITDDKGGIFTAGTPFFGAMGSLRDDAKTKFTKAVGLTALDANDPMTGYRIWNEDGTSYGFNKDTLGKFGK